MKLFCPNGHLLFECELSSTGDFQIKDASGYTMCLTHAGEVHLLGCRLCELAPDQPSSQTEGIFKLADLKGELGNASNKVCLVSYLPDSPLFSRKWVNDHYCHIFGVTPEQVIGRSCLESTPEARRADVQKKICSCIATNELMVSVEANRKADGSLVLIRWVDVPITDGTQNVVEMLAIGVPFEDRREGNGHGKRAMLAP